MVEGLSHHHAESKMFKPRQIWGWSDQLEQKNSLVITGHLVEDVRGNKESDKGV